MPAEPSVRVVDAFVGGYFATSLTMTLTPIPIVVQRERRSVAGALRDVEEQAVLGQGLGRLCAEGAGQCTASTHRVIVRSFFEEDMETMHQRASVIHGGCASAVAWPSFPFETMKWMMGMPRFLVRGLMKVRGEFALSVLTYNLKRVIDIPRGA